MFSFKTVALYEMWITEFFFLTQDTDIIIDRIKKSTRELEQGPIGKNLSSAEKREFVVNTVCTDSIHIVCLPCRGISYYVSNSNDVDTRTNNVSTKTF
jgi:hypothetical protein